MIGGGIAAVTGYVTLRLYVRLSRQPRRLVAVKEKGRKLIAQNRKARHDYSILDTYEAGVALMGTEVKRLRLGRASLVDGFATIDDGEVWLRDVHIPEYTQGSWTNHEPRRTRKLLLHREEIERLIGKTRESGLTLVPLSLYFTDGKVKVRAGAGARQAVLRQAAGPRQARRRPRDPAGLGRAAKGRARGCGDPAGGRRRRPGVRGGARPARAGRRAHPLPARAASWTRSGATSTRPTTHYGTAWPVHYRTSVSRAARHAATSSACRRSPRWSTRTSPAWPVAHRVGTRVRRADPGRRADRHALPRARRGRRTSARRSRRARGWSRCTCRSAASIRATRCCARCGGCSPRRACRRSCTAAAARCPARTPASTCSARCSPRTRG